MRAYLNRRCALAFVLWVCLQALLCEPVFAAGAGRAIIPELQQEFGLSEPQIRGALGALLLYVNQRLPKADFDHLANRIPNAQYIMDEVKRRGVVTKPLDNIDDYESALVRIGISEPVASQFAPAVERYLGAAGFYNERDILARALD